MKVLIQTPNSWNLTSQVVYESTAVLGSSVHLHILYSGGFRRPYKMIWKGSLKPGVSRLDMSLVADRAILRTLLRHARDPKSLWLPGTHGTLGVTRWQWKSTMYKSRPVNCSSSIYKVFFYSMFLYWRGVGNVVRAFVAAQSSTQVGSKYSDAPQRRDAQQTMALMHGFDAQCCSVSRVWGGEIHGFAESAS